MSCNVNVPDLIRCAERGEELAVVELLKRGEDPNSTDDMGLSALHCASKKGHTRVVDILLSHKADPNSTSISWRRETPLHYACKYGHLGIVQMLLASGAKLEAETQQNKTPLQIAKDNKHGSIEEILEVTAAFRARSAQKPS